jgi:hypothetical protein
VPVIAGNVATAPGVFDLAGRSGCSESRRRFRSICITRMVTGFGVPQINWRWQNALG